MARASSRHSPRIDWIIEVAETKSIVLRLFGGLAVRFHCPSATHRALNRKYADIDFMGFRKQSRNIQKLFIELGYAPRDLQSFARLEAPCFQ